jgi:hypothetical protein
MCVVEKDADWPGDFYIPAIPGNKEQTEFTTGSRSASNMWEDGGD